MLTSIQRSGCSLGFSGLDDGESISDGDGVLLSQNLVDEREQLVLDAGDRVLLQAVGVDAVEEVVLRLDGVAPTPRLFLLGQSTRTRHQHNQAQCTAHTVDDACHVCFVADDRSMVARVFAKPFIRLESWEVGNLGISFQTSESHFCM